MLVYNITYINEEKENMEDLPGTRLLFDDDGTPFPEPKKKVRKQTKSDMTFEQALNALQTTHTLSTRMICELLKTYRPWVTKYILPKLDKIYLNNGKKGTSRKSFGINWVYMAAQALENEEITESAWYKTSDFESLLKNSLTTCTRQTIKVSATIFMNEHERESFLALYNIIQEDLQENKKKRYKERSMELLKEKADLETQIESLFDKYIGKNIMKELKNVVSIDEYGISKRTLTPPLKYKMEWDYHNFMAIHDLKGYGGIDEIIYRDLFDNGAVKLVFNFVAPNGDIGEKVFYTYDEQDKKYRLNDGSPEWAVPYTFFMKYKKL